MIPDFKTYLGESVWGDIRKKSLGQEERMEDNVNSLTKDQFYEYLLDNYILVSPPKNRWETEDGIGNGTKYVRVPLFRKAVNSCSFDILIDFEKRYMTCKKSYFDIDVPENIKEFIYNDCKFAREGKRGGMCYITSKDGETDNKFFLNVINYVINNVKIPRLRRK